MMSQSQKPTHAASAPTGQHGLKTVPSGNGARHLTCPAALIVCVLWLPGCGPQKPDQSGPLARPSSPHKERAADKPLPRTNEGKTYPLAGVVEKVDSDAAEITIRHEAIAGFMPKMTMPFAVADRRLLARAHAGDEVKGRLRVRSDASVLETLEVTRPAPTGAVPVQPEASPAAQPRELKPGEKIPDFEMTTQDGKPLRLSDLRGKVVVLTFIYTRCPLPDFCPLIDRKFRELAAKIGAVRSRANAVRLVSVSFDPEHDTPEVLRQHARNQGAQPPLWTYAVARHEELAKVAGAIGLTYIPGSDEISHNLATAVIDSVGRLVLLEHGRKWEPADLFRAIVAALPPHDR
jgi:protein SCO1